MSRSYKKTPRHGHSLSKSEKADKRMANRKLRRIAKIKIMDEVLPKLREVSDVWGMSKDGKQYFNKEKYPEEMRK